MKKLLSLLFLLLVVVLPLAARAQQATPAAKPSTPVAGKRSTPAPGGARSSAPAAGNLAMPVEAKPTRAATPVPAKSSASSTDSETTTAPTKPHSTNWEVYPADRMPAGKSLTDAEAAKLASGDYSGKVLYLVGNFYVGAAQKDRAILWPGEKSGPIHVVVSYPLSIPLPEEGTKVVRDAPRGFRITRIKHPSPAETTIYVREITIP